MLLLMFAAHLAWYLRLEIEARRSASGRRVGNLERLDDVVRLIASSSEARHQIRTKVIRD